MVKFNRHWSDAMILNHIHRKEAKEPLNYHHHVTNYPDVHAAAERIFGSWKNAIEACGIDYKKIRKYQQWSRKKIVEEIKKLHNRKRKLSSNHIQKNNKPLYMAAVRKFGSWGRAVKAAGIDYDKIRLRRSMTKKEIKEQVLELFSKKESLAYTNMRKKYQPLLTAGAKKFGNGSWAVARKKCGIRINYRSPAEKKQAGVK